MKTIRFDTKCISCICNKFTSNLPSNMDEEQKLGYAKKMLRIMADAPDTMSAPEIVAEITALKNATFGFKDDFAEIKQHFNALMMKKESDVLKSINNSCDPLLTAVCYAMLGNYIDFGAMDNVDEQKLEEMLKNVGGINPSTFEFEQLKADLEKAKRLVYLTDNCGEILLDKLLLKTLKKAYPELNMTVIVRGEAVLNDATLDDALQIGLPDVCPVIPNGTNVAGTCLDRISAEAKKTIDLADVIISKGQGNFETLHDCGLNVYYLFLCKCNLYSERFKVPALSGMLLNDKRMNKQR